MRNQGRQENYDNFNQGWNSYPSIEQARPSNKQQQQQPSLHERQIKLEETVQHCMQVSLSSHKNTTISIRNLETQLGQLTKKVGEKFEKNFIANTEVNLKEHCNAIIT